LEKGGIDVVPEYAATLAGQRGRKVLPVGADVDQNVFAVSQGIRREEQSQDAFRSWKAEAEGEDRGGRRVRGAAVLCAGSEEARRSPKKTYGIDVAGIDPKGVGTPRIQPS
jgi:osmoprotectant transport system substrate-binding protein